MLRQQSQAASPISPLAIDPLRPFAPRAPHFAPDTAVEMEVTVEHVRHRARATVRKLPFYDPERKKA